jgi:hypothetical protein
MNCTPSDCCLRAAQYYISRTDWERATLLLAYALKLESQPISVVGIGGCFLALGHPVGIYQIQTWLRSLHAKSCLNIA